MHMSLELWREVKDRTSIWELNCWVVFKAMSLEQENSSQEGPQDCTMRAPST